MVVALGEQSNKEEEYHLTSVKQLSNLKVDVLVTY